MFQHSETVDSIITEDTPDRSQTPTGSGVSHTVDGMILVTTSGVFQCQPRTSPEKLFLELAVSSSDTSAADVLAITSGLDVNKLYEVGMSFIYSSWVLHEVEVELKSQQSGQQSWAKVSTRVPGIFLCFLLPISMSSSYM